jgi:hypothetical protein
VPSAVPYREQQHKPYSASLPANRFGSVTPTGGRRKKKNISNVYCTFLVMVIVGGKKHIVIK